MISEYPIASDPNNNSTVGMRQMCSRIFRMCVSLSILFVIAHAAAPFCQANSDSDLVARALLANTRDLGTLRGYVYTKTTERVEYDNQNRAVRSSTKVSEVFYLDGAPYERIEKMNGLPLSDAQRQNQERSMDKAIADAKSAVPKHKQERERKAAQTMAKELAIRQDVAEGFTFTKVADEQRDGYNCIELRAEPKTGFKWKSSLHALLPLIHGYIWIDKDTGHWVDIEAFPIKKLGKGPIYVNADTALHLHQNDVRDGLWVLTKFNARVDMRLLKRKNIRVIKTYGNFRRFSTSVRIQYHAETASDPSTPATVEKP